MPSETAAIANLSHPSHSSLIYETPAEQAAVTCEYLARGLTRGELCVFLESPERLQAVREGLAEAGIDVAAEEQRGALVLSSGVDFLDQGHFNGTRTIGFLEATLARAQKQGYSALRATGDMNWELGADQDFELLIDYEARLDQFVRRHAIVGLCQYRRRSIPGLAIRNALETHELVIMGRLLCTNNLYYEPPEVRLNEESTEKLEKRAEWMCRHLLQAMQAERQRDSAMRALLQNEQRFKEELARRENGEVALRQG